VHDRSWSGAQADGAGIPSAGKVPKPAPDAGGWARADEFRCAEASVTVRATPAREAAPLIRSVLSRRIGGGRKGVKDDRRE